MNEIEKMMQNANIEKEVIKGCYDYYSKLGIDIWKENDCRGENCDTCKKDKSIKRYPPFTAEKQIELIKNISPVYPLNYHIKCFQGYSFEEGLAKCINNLWQYLTEEEKHQIKEILE